MTSNSLINTASFTPNSLQPPNAWVGHLPFAAWVIQEIEPKIFVELGTHTGNSYFAFCQSVVENNIPTKCYAVDTWQGDEHAGQYSNDVFVKVNEHNQEHYAEFSLLFRMTFDDALSSFADESIDLLHIDGLHTYESVRHDFETWLPKLAPGAVVMFHDTNVRERGFGVWKLWEELQVNYSNNLEFVHSHGLGVLQINNVPYNKKFEWLQPDTFTKQQLISYFASIGARQLERYESYELKTYVANLRQAIAECDGQIDSLNQTIAEREKHFEEWALKIVSSTSWRITLPLREAKKWVSSPKIQAKRYFKWLLRSTKRCYQKLPLSYKTKAAHRNMLAKFAPKLLLAIASDVSNLPILILPILIELPEKYENKIDFVKNINIPLSQQPVVSIIIPIYGQIDYTLRCLASIGANLPKVSFEVIVVDDCSPDNSSKVLKANKHIYLIQNTQNQGFIRSCNAGAKKAQGEFLYFLNNDTQVTPGWLDELLLTFEQFPGTGLVGSKLIYPDGRLQEAGGIIWQDGSAWNFGRLQDPLLPVYNYAREVDYCSGASIMVPKALYDELGGFDEHYLPAYCEDYDLALKVRAKGYRVIYQPMSTVVHYEGVTSGTDLLKGAKAYQVQNLDKAFEIWKDKLLDHQPNGVNVDKAKDRCSTRRVLVLDHCTPMPNHDAGSLLTFNMLLLLREMDFQVTFIPEDNFLYMPLHTPELQRVGVEVLYAPYVVSVEQHVKEFGDRYDLVLLFRPVTVERHLSSIKTFCKNAKFLYHTVDLHFLRIERESKLHNDNKKLKASEIMKIREYTAIKSTDVTIVVSAIECDLLRLDFPDIKLHVYPLIMDINKKVKSLSTRKNIVFVGGYQHAPNIDAVKYFVSEIMPLLRVQLPGVKFFAVGSNLTKEIEALSCDDVIITGFVDDLNLLLDEMRVSIAPLRYGAGIKGKISGAMAAGLPSVSTTIGAEGMSLIDGENILLADDAVKFATAIVKLYSDEELWNQISVNGLLYAEKVWGSEAAWNNLAVILNDLNFNTVRKKRPLTLYKRHFNVNIQ